jgi:membrane protease YdiL (CAAX protease family)
MSRSNLRIAIIVLTLITAAVHLTLNFPDPVFILNCLGYIALMIVFFKFVRVPFLAGREKLVWYAYMGFVAVTILAWVAIGTRNIVGYADKAVEVLLLIALWLHKEN